MLDYGLYIMVYLTIMLLPNKQKLCTVERVFDGQEHEFRLVFESKKEHIENWSLYIDTFKVSSQIDTRKHTVLFPEIHPVAIQMPTLLSLPRRKTHWRKIESIEQAYILDETYHSPVLIEQDRKEKTIYLRQEKGFLFPESNGIEKPYFRISWEKKKRRQSKAEASEAAD